MNSKQINKEYDKRAARAVKAGTLTEYSVMRSIYQLIDMGNGICKLVESTTRNVIRTGNDCEEYAKRMGITLEKGGK